MDARAVATPYLQLAGVRKVYDHGGQQTVALGHVDLTVDDGEFLAIVGPSGCGKSTLLQIAAGLAPASAGEVRFRGVPVTAPPEGIVYLFQQYGKSLLPWRTVVDNVAPVLTVPAPSTINCGESPVFSEPTATDACGSTVTIAQVGSDVTTPSTTAGCNSYSITRTWVATDACGNASAPMSSTITVVDNVAPVLTASN